MPASRVRAPGPPLAPGASHGFVATRCSTVPRFLGASQEDPFATACGRPRS